MTLLSQNYNHAISSGAGDLQSTLLILRDSVYEASVALSTYGGIVGGHSALTSECGAMLEEVFSVYLKFTGVEY